MMRYPDGTTNTPRVSSPFGPRKGGAFSFHYGADLIGFTTIHAVAGGLVTFAGWMNNAAGNTVIIDHGGGVTSLYMHNAAHHVRRGERVTEGQRIATMGRTGNADGNCCHLEIRQRGTSVEPLAYVRARLTTAAPAAAPAASPVTTHPIEIGDHMFIADCPNGSFLIVPQGGGKPRAVVLDGGSGAASSGIPRLKFETPASLGMLTAAVQF